MSEHDFGDEDRKLVVLARGALARAGTGSGAAVRDTDGRTYAGAAVATTTLRLTALQVAVATALSSGAPGFEAAVLVAGSADDPGVDTLREISADAALYVTDTAGRLLVGGEDRS
ncbi:cytidine deaminase [Gordonia sp. TBRC 11910]|uniref:Cytidine deaminase n=1 Tax=Gordonia asplenii TaxID=2725283 RepID=A0A848KRE0_9ACTN|nr:cytidine deaminase [Gordonia asplenii]NMO01266.1 cytidine deaminase [Gordonia asplenii]